MGSFGLAAVLRKMVKSGVMAPGIITFVVTPVNRSVKVQTWSPTMTSLTRFSAVCSSSSFSDVGMPEAWMAAKVVMRSSLVMRLSVATVV